jgi:hypothetical protein
MSVTVRGYTVPTAVAVAAGEFVAAAVDVPESPSSSPPQAANKAMTIRSST